MYIFKFLSCSVVAFLRKLDVCLQKKNHMPKISNEMLHVVSRILVDINEGSYDCKDGYVRKTSAQLKGFQTYFKTVKSIYNNHNNTPCLPDT